jgi:sirohydrochlorin ferrochelatase
MVPPLSGTRCLLFDNGSLRPESTLNLRVIASRLQSAIGGEVQAASLFHSSSISPDELEGVPAQLLEPVLGAWLAAGVDEIVLLPLFFGPSAALTDHLPRQLGPLRRHYPGRRIHLGRWIVDPCAANDFRVATILAENVREVNAAQALEFPNVVLVDHGSPQRAVVAVRDLLVRQLAVLLAGEIGRLVAASMERRPGPEFDFCDPLLAAALRRPEFSGSRVVVAQQFFSPGRHAGPGGDVAEICAAAEKANPGMRTFVTKLIGADPRLVPVLCDRYREARAPAPFWNSGGHGGPPSMGL